MLQKYCINGELLYKASSNPYPSNKLKFAQTFAQKAPVLRKWIIFYGTMKIMEMNSSKTVTSKIKVSKVGTFTEYDPRKIAIVPFNH